MVNLLDLMTEEDRQKSLAAYERRMNGDTSYRKSSKVSSVSFLIAECGYYYGWGAIEAIKRGYIIGHSDTGRVKKIPLTLEEVSELVEAARKVWYSKVVDSSRGHQVATMASFAEKPIEAFEQGISGFKEAIDE